MKFHFFGQAGHFRSSEALCAMTKLVKTGVVGIPTTKPRFDGLILFCHRNYVVQ